MSSSRRITPRSVRRALRRGVVVDPAAALEPQVAGRSGQKHLGIRLPDAATLRALSWVSPDVWQGHSLTVQISNFTPPAPGWRPRVPAIGRLASFDIDHDAEGHCITFTLTLTEPTSLPEFAQALAPLAEPLPSRLAGARAAIGVEAPDPPTQAPTLLAIPDPEGGDTSDPTVPPWDLVADLGEIAQPTSDSIARVRLRSIRPLIDLSVHNPIGRPPFKPNRTATIRRTQDALQITRSGSRGNAGAIVLPLRSAVTRQNVVALHALAATLDCSDLALQADDDAPHLSARLAELAATGVICHSAPLPATESLDPRLAEMVRAPGPAQDVLVIEGELRSVRQRRRALQAHSLAARWFAPTDPLAPPPLTAAPEVSVVLATKRPENLADVLRALAAESYPRMEILVGIHGDGDAPDPALLNEWAGGRGLRAARFAASATLGEILGRLSDLADGQLIAKVDDDDLYGPHHLADLVLAQAYSRADAVGLALWHRHFVAANLSTAARRRVSEVYTHFVPGGTLTATRQILSEIGGWRPVPRSVDRALLQRILRMGGLVYRTHGFGYVYCRHLTGHTWNPDESAIIAKTGDRWDGLAPVQVETASSFDPATCRLAPQARPTVVYQRPKP
ncbi:MAG: glycosyltransferase family 2 protein [Bifidobacteriaceae bacterium]|jgi:hypothetical protein|nr:glycosyltransferase family 2 protein [Bifidobacteriaceae bacterium]